MAASKKKTTAQSPGDDRTVVEPSVRVFTKWTPQLVQYAEIAADNGNLTQAARICEWLLSDDTIRGCLSARVNGLLGLVPSFEKSGDKRRSGRAVNALEAGEDYWVSYPEPELWLMIVWGLLLGIAPMRHQPRYVDGHGGRLLPCPEFWHPANGLRWDSQRQSWFIKVAAPGEVGSGTEEAIEAGDGTWVLHAPFGKHRPHSLGLWRCLAWWKLLKDFGRGDQARHMEKGSLLVLEQDELKNPILPGPGGSTQKRDADAASLYQRGKDAVAALAAGQHVKLVETSGSASQIYESAYAEANKAFAIAIRGGNLTTNTEGGSKAAAEVQERTGDFVNLRFDAESIANTLHSQSLNWWAAWNFGDAKLAPWPDYPVAPQRNLETYAKSIKAFNDAVAALELQGFEVDRQGAIDEFELQEFVKPGKKPESVVPVAAPADPKAAKATSPAPKSGPATPEQARAVAVLATEGEADPLLDALKEAPRAIIVGGPRSGKTTLAVRASERFSRPVRHADDLMNELEFEAAGEAVAKWFDDEGDAVIEGVAAVRGLRAWLNSNPGKELGWAIVMLAAPKVPLSKGQAAMASGIQTIWAEILPELRARNTTITEEQT